LSRNETWNLQPRLAWLFPEGVSAGPGTIGIEENEIFPFPRTSIQSRSPLSSTIQTTYY